MDNTIQLYVTDLEGVRHSIRAPTDIGLNLMEAIRANDLQIKATCGGMALCASCHVLVCSQHFLAPKSEDEEAMLDEANLLKIQNSRLGCQIILTPDMDGLEVQLGESTGA